MNPGAWLAPGFIIHAGEGVTMTFTLEPITVDDDFAFRYAVYASTIKPYLDKMLDWSDDEHEARLYENMRDGGGHCALVVDGERVGVVLIHESPTAIALVSFSTTTGQWYRSANQALTSKLCQPVMIGGLTTRPVS